MKMFKNVSIIIIAACFTVLSIFSCSKSTSNEAKIDQELTDVSIVKMNLKSMPKEVLELNALRDEIAIRMIGDGISKELIQNSIRSQDFSEMKKAINLTNDEYYSYSLKLSILKEKILNNYPQVQKELMLKKECKNCNFEKSSLFLTTLVNNSNSSEDIITVQAYLNNKKQQASVAEIDCRWAAVM